MNHKFEKSIATGILVTLSLALILATSFFAGCSDKLSGDVRDNQRPIVYFVNVPPAPQYDTLSLTPLVIDTVYTRFSRNPFIYWYGTDIDGQIDYYRYTVVTVPEMGSMTPDEMAAVLEGDSVAWTYLDVSASESDPHTTEIVKLRALSEDPVNTYLVQYVFLQAYDEEGLGSFIKYRPFSRNDSPPTVAIAFIDTTVAFINSMEAGIITGISMSWTGSDPDYPSGTEAPPFEYQWRLYGPYDSLSFLSLKNNYLKSVYLTSDAEVYRVGDTIFCDQEEDPGCEDYVIKSTDVFYVNDLGDTDGQWKFFFDVDSLANDSAFNRIVTMSDGWTNDSSVTIYNAYRNYNPPPGGDTTVMMKFVFWVTCRDDAKVETPIPAVSFTKDQSSHLVNSFRVIDPKFERSVLVIDHNMLIIADAASEPNNPVSQDKTVRFQTQRNYWKGVIDAWGQAEVPGWDNSSFNVNLDRTGSIAPDYIIARAAMFRELPVVEMLKHKIVILYNDDIANPKLYLYTNVWRAIDAGCNVWSVMRSPLEGGKDVGDIKCQMDIETDNASTTHHKNFRFYFGVAEINYSGWYRHYFKADSANPFHTPMRIEHFIRATSSETMGSWPTLTVDTARLHSMYNWDRQDLGWIPDTAALPEVNWASYRPKYSERGATMICKPMYIFGSRYGQNNHPGGGCLPGYDGSPVAHWLRATFESGEPYFKTVYFSFTPLSLEQTSFQITANRVLNYLYNDNRLEP